MAYLNDTIDAVVVVADREITLSVAFEFMAIYDKHYGADADGNRGVGRWFTEINIIRISDRGVRDVTEKVRDRYPDTYESIIEQINQYAERELEL